MEIADIIRSVVSPPGVNTDPNTGAVLRDRFHQIRGNEIATRDDTMLGNLSQQFLASRGAPITPQNLVIAQEYLRGGALGRLEQQQAADTSIADAAIAAEGGGAASSGSRPSDAASPPAPRPTALPPESAPVDVMETGPGGPNVPDDVIGAPLIPPALMVGAAARAATGTDVTARDPGINGQIMPDENGMVRVPGPNGTQRLIPGPQAAAEGWTVVGVNADAGNQVQGPGGRLRLGAPDAIDAEYTDVTPHAAVGNADDADWGYKSSDPASRPIDTDEVINTSKQEGGSVTKTGTGSAPDGSGKSVNYTVYRDPSGGFVAQADGTGDIVTGKTADEVRRAIRTAIRGLH